MNDRFNRFKFRAWNKKKQEMKNVAAIIIHADVYYSLKLNRDEIAITPCKQPYIILMQCTGLKDKNGKLVFEGDIVDCYVSIKNPYRYQVKYEIGSFMLVSPHEKNSNLYPLCQLYSECENEEERIWHCEVIGNIYENPELLEVK